MLPATNLALTLPLGWFDHANEDVRELWNHSDDTRGVLQVSRFIPEQAAFVAAQADLGALAGEMGRQLGGKVGTWGRVQGTKEATCALGRLGVAVFVEGQFPSMLLFVAASQTDAYLWTYLGPDPSAREVNDATQIVLTAKV